MHIGTGKEYTNKEQKKAPELNDTELGFSTHQMISFMGIWMKFRMITTKFQGR